MEKRPRDDLNNDYPGIFYQIALGLTMSRTPNYFEQNLAEYLKSGEPIVDGFSDDDNLDELVEIAILPGYSKSNLDDMWITYLNDSRIGAPFFPDENFQRFFEVMNIHPRDVLTESHFQFKPAVMESYYNGEYRRALNKNNAEIVGKYFELLNNFEIDSTRPALCSPEHATAILDNASRGGVPIIAGYATVREILALDFDYEITLNGKFQVGIWDTLNGAGHMESSSTGPFKMKLSRQDLIVLKTKGYTPDESCGFVKRFYRMELSSETECATA